MRLQLLVWFSFSFVFNTLKIDFGNDLLYTGREYDRDTSLYYYRARYYDPEIGRFISEDPLGFEAGINFYAYVNNNPVNFNDPTGRETQIGISSNLTIFGLLKDAIRINTPNRQTTIDIGGGLGGQGGVGISVGDSFWDTQFYIQGRVTTFGASPLQMQQQLGPGFIGIGAGLDVSQTDGPLPVLRPIIDNNIRVEANAGLIVSGGVAWEKNPDTGDIVSASGPLPGAGNLGFGLGFMVADGESTTVTLATPTFGQIRDDFLESISGMFGGVDGVSSGGFVLYPNRPNMNMMQRVYSK